MVGPAEGPHLNNSKDLPEKCGDEPALAGKENFHPSPHLGATPATLTDRYGAGVEKAGVRDATAEHLIYLIALFSAKDEADIKPEMGLLTDIGLDSYDAVELVMQAEEDFGIEIPDEVAERILTVGDALREIKTALATLPTPEPSHDR